MRMRDNRLDVAKGVLIVLVVLGHLLEEVSGEWEDGLVRLVLTVIYAFHMPAFVFLAGLTAKSTRLLERLLTFVMLLGVFQCLYFVAKMWAGDSFEWSWTTPHWILWFLVGMIGWTLTVPLIERFPRTMVAVSLVASIGVGLVPFAGYDFSLSRMLVFWPFFVLGRTVGPRLLKVAAGLQVWTAIGLCVVAIVPTIALFIVDIDKGWLYGSRNFESLEVSDGRGMLIRVCLLLIALVAIVALVAAVPDSRGPVAVMGQRSLSVFLLHGLVVIALTPALAEFFAGGYGHAVQIGAVVISGFAAWGVAFVLALQPSHWVVSTPPKKAAAALVSLVNPRERRRTAAALAEADG